MTKVTVTNVTRGFRGLNTVDGYVELAPGESREGVELEAAERKSADGTRYFEFGSGAAKAVAAAPAADAPLPNNVPKLKKIARDEGVELGTAKTVAEITALIVAARTAKAGPGTAATPATIPPADDLDNMSDADLATTTAAITGTAVDKLPTDREALLKLARGQE